MPTLPTLDVSQGHFDRLVAAFPGNNAAEKTASYKAWLTNSLIDYVEQVESRQIDQETNSQKIIKMEALRDSLPSRVPFPPES